MSSENNESVELLSSIHSAKSLARANDEIAALAKSVTANSDTEALRKMVADANTASRALKAFAAENSAVFSAFSLAMNEQRNAMRLALGPLEDLKRFRLETDAFLAERNALSDAVRAFHEQFRRPEVQEMARLVAEMKSQLVMHRPQIESFQAAVAQMRTPWLSIQNEFSSARSFAALQSIGESLRRSGAFDETSAALLRSNLGDWRDRIDWPKNIFEDIQARGQFYEDRGFDPSLTDFPAEAFEESVEIAGLVQPVPRIIEVTDYTIPASNEAEESGFERTNAAQSKLLRFEHHLRRFIDARMKAAFGENWIDQKVDDVTRGKWAEKKRKAEEGGGAAHPLIDYADFTDYERVILRGKNWDDVFRPIFKRQEFIREAFQRLYPVRLCSYHARLISQDDELLLHVEVKRILVAIGILPRG